MAPLDMDVAHEVHNYIRKKGLKLYLGKKCTELTAKSVILDDGTAILADNLCGKKVTYKGSQGTSVMKFFDLTVAVTGEKEESLKQAGTPYRKTFTYSASHAGYYPCAIMMSIKLVSTNVLTILQTPCVPGLANLI